METVKRLQSAQLSSIRRCRGRQSRHIALSTVHKQIVEDQIVAVDLLALAQLLPGELLGQERVLQRVELIVDSASQVLGLLSFGLRQTLLLEHLAHVLRIVLALSLGRILVLVQLSTVADRIILLVDELDVAGLVLVLVLEQQGLLSQLVRSVSRLVRVRTQLVDTLLSFVHHLMLRFIKSEVERILLLLLVVNSLHLGLGHR